MTATHRRGLRLLVRLVVLASVAIVGLAAPAAPASAADDGTLGIRLLDAPEERRDDPRARLYIVDHLTPGTTISRRVQVTNGGSQPLDVNLYPGPSQIADGAWLPDGPGATSELTAWTSLGQDRATIQPGEVLDVPVTIAVPSDASEGERYGVVWAETASADDHNVEVVSRVGIRIYLSVGPGGEPASSFEISSMTAERTRDGGYRIVAEVRNTGGRALDLEGELKLTDGPDGLAAGPYPTSQRVTLAPGDRGQVPVQLEGTLPRGPWRALLTLRSGELVEKARAALTFPEEGSGAPVDATPVTPESTPWWWWTLAGAAVLAVLAGAWRLLRRRAHG